MRPKPVKEGQGIFLSYYEGSDKSRPIVDQLYEFFNNWKLKCYVIRNIEGTGTPKNLIRESLIKSRYLLQLFTDHRNVRDWMKWEWDIYEAVRTALGLDRGQPVLLHTTETDFKDPSFSALNLDVHEGRLKSCNIDKAGEVRSLLGGILLETARLPKEHGPIELPAFCQPAVGSERMTWDIVEEFIRNFRGASVKGLERFYADRNEMMPHLKERLAKLQYEKGLVRMIGFTLKDYLIRPEPRGNADSVDVGSAFQSAIDNGANAKLLLLDRDCEAAKERARIETPGKEHKKTLLYTDSCKVSNYYFNKAGVEIQYYDTPYVGLVLFEDEAYVEVYHLGKQNPDKDICGRVPILGVKKRNEPGLYELFDRHFSSVWKSDRMAVSRSTDPPGAVVSSGPKPHQVSRKTNLRLRRDPKLRSVDNS